MKYSTRYIIDELFVSYPELLACKQDIVASLQIMINGFQSGAKLLICGNGGSAADAQHIVGELMKSFVLPRELDVKTKANIEAAFPESAEYLTKNLQMALPALSLVSETSLISAYANDVAPNLGFAQQVFGHGNKGDILLSISTSGNSLNVIYATQIAKVRGMNVIGMTGEKGGKLRELTDVLIAVPANETYRVQEYHLPVYHALCMALEYEFFGE